MSITSFSRRQHDNHLTHDCRQNFIYRNTELFFKCDGCKMNGFGERYTCNLCRSRFHMECAHPIPSISHENFPGSIFKFYSKPFTVWDSKKNCKKFSKLCYASGKEICGFNYHCGADSLDLHPCCRKLGNKLIIDDMIFDLVTKISSKCVKCGKQKISRDERNVRGWSYVSQCKKYRLHVYCLTDIIQEVYMKRENLTLNDIDSIKLVTRYRNGNGENTFVTCAKLVIKILVSVLLGDVTTLFSGAMVELFVRHLWKKGGDSRTRKRIQ